MQNAVLHQALPWGNKPILNVLEAKRMLGLVSSDKVTVTNSDYFDIYTSHPVELREDIPTPSQYEDLNEGIPPAQNTTPDSFIGQEDIVTVYFIIC